MVELGSLNTIPLLPSRSVGAPLVGGVAALASLFFCSGGALSLYALFCVPHATLSPLFLLGLSIAGVAFFTLVVVVIAGVLLFIQNKKSSEVKKSQEDSTDPTTHNSETKSSSSSSSSEETPETSSSSTEETDKKKVPPLPQALVPGNFLGVGLSNICWANAMLQMLRLMDDDLKAQFHQYTSKPNAPDYGAIKVLSNLIVKMDRNESISKEEMLELMQELKNLYSNFDINHKDRNSPGHYMMDATFVLSDVLMVIYPNPKRKMIITPFYQGNSIGVLKQFLNREFSYNHFPLTLGEVERMARQEDDLTEEIHMPKTLLVRNIQLNGEPLNSISRIHAVRPDDRDLYTITIPNSHAQEISVKYRLKGTIERPSYHFTARASIGNSSYYVHYNDSRASLVEGPLYTTNETFLALFEKVEE